MALPKNSAPATDDGLGVSPVDDAEWARIIAEESSFDVDPVESAAFELILPSQMEETYRARATGRAKGIRRGTASVRVRPTSRWSGVCWWGATARKLGFRRLSKSPGA